MFLWKEESLQKPPLSLPAKEQARKPFRWSGCQVRMVQRAGGSESVRCQSRQLHRLTETWLWVSGGFRHRAFGLGKEEHFSAVFGAFRVECYKKAGMFGENFWNFLWNSIVSLF